MPKKGRGWRRVGRVFGVLSLLLGILVLYVVLVSKTRPPKVQDISALQWKRSEVSPGFYTMKNDWLRKSPSGLFEMYVEGQPFERGIAHGRLGKELVETQEEYFTDQIKKMIPSPSYLKFLRYFVGWFNRDLPEYVLPEYKEEIYGVSESASDKYDFIGSNYERILNYHSAHDIGHALQNLALVGCTSFGTWGSRSADSSMIIGRNFDFYAGEHFSENKIVLFEKPAAGHKFMSVTWGGFIGVVSGMNDRGLTVTINAAKSEIPTGAATPVSLVAREILQYAENIDQALAIARKRKMFVSESFLIGSAADHRAAIIEKTPDSVGLYDPHLNYIVCANQFQSPALERMPSNQNQIKNSASQYRTERLQQLLAATAKNSVAATAAILRDRRGKNGQDIGEGNEKAVNQLIAHHSVIFEPEKGLVWVSTSPWQLGKYVCYDLNRVFGLAGIKQEQEIADTARDVPADPFLSTTGYKDFLRFSGYREKILSGGMVNPDSLVASNPEFYQAYELAGNELMKQKAYDRALHYYEEALRKVIATKGEENGIRKKLIICQQKLKNAS